MKSSNFTLKILTFFPLFIGLSLFGEPFLAPHDPFLRHEIRLLQDQGVLDSNLNSWPLNLGGLSYEMDNNSNYDLFDRTMKRESQSGWSPINYTVGFSDDRVTSRSFGNQPRSRFTTGFERSWMNDFFAAKLSLHVLYGVEDDWKGRKEDGLVLDGSYIATRLGNWSASLGKVDRWWGPGWDGSLILSHNARPIPAISIDRRISDPFETKWLSWIGPWSFHSFIGQMEEERTIPHPYIWGIRVDFNPTLLDGLEIGLFRMMQLGGEGRPEGFSTWVDAFLSQDNYGANSKYQDKSKEPGNQLAGLDVRLRLGDLPLAFYCQIAGEDEDKFLPNALMFQYGIEWWGKVNDSIFRVFVEYADLTSFMWTDAPQTRNVSYNHSIYQDGYRYMGRAVGHWADSDSQILSLGTFFQLANSLGWGTIARIGELNDGGGGRNSVSNGVSSDYLSIQFLNTWKHQKKNLHFETSVGFERLKIFPLTNSNYGLKFSFIASRDF